MNILFKILKWLFKDRTLKGFIRRIYKVIIVLGSWLLFYFLVQNVIYKKTEGIILVSLGGIKTFIGLIAFIILTIMTIINLRKIINIIILIKNNPKVVRFFVKMDKELYPKNTIIKNFKISLIITISSLIITIYVLNNPIIFYKDKIVTKNLVPFLEKEYDYKDIEKLILKTKDDSKFINLEVKVITKDKRSLEIDNKELQGLMDISEIMKSKNIKREIDDRYLESSIMYLDQESKENYRKLFR